MTNQLATTQKSKLTTLLDNEIVKSRFYDTIGPGSGAWITAIINAVNLSPKLEQCDPVSIITAGLNAAVLRLSVDPSVGHSAIVPFKKKAVFVPMAKGIKQLAMRTGQYRIINVTPIYNGEEIVEDRMTGIQTIDGGKVSDDIIGYYGYFKLKNGFESTIYMDVVEIELHAKKYSPSFNRKNGSFYTGSLWLENFDAMARKTVLRLMLTRDGVLDIGGYKFTDNGIEGDSDAEFELELHEIIDAEESEPVEPVAQLPFDEDQTLLELGF